MTARGPLALHRAHELIDPRAVFLPLAGGGFSLEVLSPE